jgi:hypothetical protein
MSDVLLCSATTLRCRRIAYALLSPPQAASGPGLSVCGVM